MSNSKSQSSPISKISTVMQNVEMGWFGVVKGQSKSSVMSPFYTTPTASYSTLTETKRAYLEPFTRYRELLIESRRFSPIPHWHLLFI